MKKLLLVLAIGTFAVACSNSAGDKAATKDTSAAPTVDTVKAAVDTTKKAADTTKPAVADTTKK